MVRFIVLVAIVATSCATPSADPSLRWQHLPLADDQTEIRGPTVLTRVEPAAPAKPISTNVPLVTRIEAAVDEEGRILDAWYVSGDRRIAPSLINAVLQWKVLPATRKGKRIAVRMSVTSTFTPIKSPMRPR